MPNPPSVHQSQFNINAYTQPYMSHCTAIEKLLHIKIQFNMKLHGHQLVILSSLAIGVLNIITSQYMITFLPLSGRLSLILWISLMFLVYPLLGHMADVYLTRYHTLKSSYVIVIIGSCGLLVYGIIDVVAELIWKFDKFHYTEAEVVPLVLFALFIIGIGLFEANAIQFGLDQLLEAPTPKLISFIHWYYWSQNVAGLVVFYVTVCGSATYSKTHNCRETTNTTALVLNVESYKILEALDLLY